MADSSRTMGLLGTTFAVQQNLEAFRLYRRRQGTLTCIATCADPQALGVALCTLHSEDEWGRPSDRVGILHRPDPDQPGTWIVSPFVSGEAPTASG